MSPARALTRLAELAVRRPWRVLAVAAGVVLASLALAGARLEIHTSNLDLVDPDHPTVARYRRFAEEFGTPNVLVVVLEGGAADTRARAAARLAGPLAGAPGVRGVVHRPPLAAGVRRAAGAGEALHSRDRRLTFLFVQPADPGARAETIEPFVAGVRRVLARTGLEGSGIRAGLTGLPVYALDDRDVVERDISRLSLVSLLLVALLFTAAFRSLAEPLAAVAALTAAVGATLGVAALWPGRLTLLSAFFASILFGLGIDFGIHLIDRVRERVLAGNDPRRAPAAAVADLAPALTTAALTTASVFWALLLCGFRGFAELGFVAGAGVLLCLLAGVTVLPALLALTASRHGRPAPGRPAARMLARLGSAPVALVVAAAALAAAALGPPPFDGDYLDLQPAGSEAVRLERAMVAGSDFSPQFAAFTAASTEEVRELVFRLLDEEEVGEVRSIADLGLLSPLGAAAGRAVDPAALAALRSAGGDYAVYAYPAGDLWDEATRDRFLAAVEAIDPQVTGMPVLGRFMVERSRRAQAVAAALGGALLLLCLAVDLRRPVPVLLAALPAALTFAALGGLMSLVGLSYNPLSVMALPVVLGIAVDDGVHLVHRFRAEGGDLGRTLAGSGRSVLLTSLTTLAAFAALALADHRGLASFAATLSLGVATALAVTLLVLPPLLVRWHEAS